MMTPSIFGENLFDEFFDSFFDFPAFDETIHKNLRDYGPEDFLRCIYRIFFI